MGDAAHRDSVGLEVNVQADSSAGDLPPLSVETWVDAAIRAAVTSTRGTVTVRLVGDEEGRDLNFRFRGRREPTNVLSFPADPRASASIQSGEDEVGDIVVCMPQARREALEQEKSVEAHVAHLVIHGALHLVGYDHADAQGARVMESLEREVLAGFGIADPYEFGAHGVDS